MANSALGTTGEGSLPAVVIHKVEEVELDEKWSFVGTKKQPWRLWERWIIRRAAFWRVSSVAVRTRQF